MSAGLLLCGNFQVYIPQQYTLTPEWGYARNAQFEKISKLWHQHYNMFKQLHLAIFFLCFLMRSSCIELLCRWYLSLFVNSSISKDGPETKLLLEYLPKIWPNLGYQLGMFPLKVRKNDPSCFSAFIGKTTGPWLHNLICIGHMEKMRFCQWWMSSVSLRVKHSGFIHSQVLPQPSPHNPISSHLTLGFMFCWVISCRSSLVPELAHPSCCSTQPHYINSIIFCLISSISAYSAKSETDEGTGIIMLTCFNTAIT